MCLKIQNLIFFCKFDLKKGVRAISVRGVFNKKLQICSTILRSYMIFCMYGYERVYLSMHEYLLAPSKV